MRLALRLARAERAAIAAEFALVLPVLLFFLFGVVDVGRFMWDLNQAEKATQIGARMAAVTDPVSSGLIAANFASTDLKPGELIPADAMAPVTCTQEECSCPEDTGGPPCPLAEDGGGVDSAAFNKLVSRMQEIKPDLTADNIRVTYSGSGFGFAGSADTEVMEVSPLITVSLEGVTFSPTTALLLANFRLPVTSTTVVAEDVSGGFSN
ncbi:hypothetical protein GCM10022280_15780 [Sphingomonas swuensis]|uniref:TadE-like domain-containing protein n=1 Tax=Sphingomonas swuensis TaxID=977800 RepID=A0ABP7SWF5_9SPHN